MGWNPGARRTAGDAPGHSVRVPALGLALWVTVAVTIALVTFPVWLALLLSVPLD